MDQELEKNWTKFVKKFGTDAYEKIDKFLTDLEDEYKKKKIDEFMEKGADHQTAIGKARQSWVGFVGDSLEAIIRLIIEPLANKYGAKVARDKEIRGTKLNLEHDLLRREILVHFNEHSFLPDADLIIYYFDAHQQKASVICIISMKNSFRERYTETPYWKLKLSQSEVTKNIDVFMVTPDRDDEISFNKRPSKARVVLEYELNGVFITKNKSEFDSSNKIGSLHDLLHSLENNLKTRAK